MRLDTIRLGGSDDGVQTLVRTPLTVLLNSYLRFVVTAMYGRSISNERLFTA